MLLFHHLSTGVHRKMFPKTEKSPKMTVAVITIQQTIRADDTANKRIYCISREIFVQVRAMLYIQTETQNICNFRVRTSFIAHRTRYAYPIHRRRRSRVDVCNM